MELEGEQISLVLTRGGRSRRRVRWDFFSRPATERFPSRCALTAKIVRSRESTAETQPQLQPALLRLSAMISQYFTRTISDNLSRMCRESTEHADQFKEP